MSIQKTCLYNVKNLKNKILFFLPSHSFFHLSLSPSFLISFPTVKPSQYLKLKYFLFIFNRSRFSKLREFSLALLGPKTSHAMLNSISQAAEAGKGVFSFTDGLHTALKDFNKSVWSAEQAKYPSGCLELSCAWDGCGMRKKSSSSDELDLASAGCMEDPSMCCLM